MSRKTRKKSKLLALAGFTVILIVAAGFVIFLSRYDIDELRDMTAAFLERAQETPYAFPIVLATYLAAGITMFPVTVLNLGCAMVFGPLWGVIYALAGALTNAATFFGIGRAGRSQGLDELLTGPRMKKVDTALRESGILGITALRFMPFPPYGIFNMAAGISSVRFSTFMIGTFLSLVPGSIARGILGDSLVKIFLHPTKEAFLYTLCGITFWLIVVCGTHLMMKHYGERKRKTEPAS